MTDHISKYRNLLNDQLNSSKPDSADIKRQVQEQPTQSASKPCWPQGICRMFLHYRFDAVDEALWAYKGVAVGRKQSSQV
ncbi:UNVERIFIED_CONTAM: hypothetical protein Slati_2672900 [Sesamum latifolium]|uniref:Uncharacterized protein n=1 Tax=Sesamum latifolium TaxID=2727402 RepID=A0AAW2VWV9_9LAMI